VLFLPVLRVGVATQLKEVMTPEFKEYAKQVKANAQAVGKALTAKGYKMATGGTENHLILWDLRYAHLPSDGLCQYTRNEKERRVLTILAFPSRCVLRF
jgi:glycine/serine hydroxymethyltransferase